MDNLHDRLKVEQDCFKIRKLLPCEVWNFLYIGITRGKSYHFEPKLPRKW